MDYPASNLPMKVLHIISGDLWAGAEVQAYTLLTHLRPHCNVTAILLNEGKLADKLRESGISVTIIDESKFATLQIYRKLKYEIKKVNPDIIHTHRQKENVLGAIANFFSIRAKCVRTIHGAPEFQGNWKSKLQNTIDLTVGNYLQDGMIFVSPFLKKKMAYQFKSKKVHVIKNGVDTLTLKNSSEMNDIKKNHPNKKNIGFIGRLTPVKRVDFFVDIAAEFKALSSQYHFHIIGDGQLRESIVEKIKALELSDLVTLHGHRNDIPSCVKSLDAVILCSEHEGLPMTLLESLALGTPVASHLGESVGDILRQHEIPKIKARDIASYKEWIENLDQLKHKIHLSDELTANFNAKKTVNLYADLT